MQYPHRGMHNFFWFILRLSSLTQGGSEKWICSRGYSNHLQCLLLHIWFHSASTVICTVVWVDQQITSSFKFAQVTNQTQACSGMSSSTNCTVIHSANKYRLTTPVLYVFFPIINGVRDHHLLLKVILSFLLNIFPVSWMLLLQPVLYFKPSVTCHLTCRKHLVDVMTFKILADVCILLSSLG